ncbi:hypothetical protein L202_06074 [Cryptococcus amylolentus CBS 6039]|uniref:GTPase-activating protein GYP5 n=1 Tax=Cryptococcus amylolentus CBS 6039 TaxID=1295533 RepID=A0A1E3HIH1_9TREE|nr:hypothetical protein L202_06074 [Cryptococcus amylolentus CBS 6039]ODN76152.1 hypothetical protein L202_06074 [Cryptococcus amylolentus CBS 6039]
MDRWQHARRSAQGEEFELPLTPGSATSSTADSKPADGPGVSKSPSLAPSPTRPLAVKNGAGKGPSKIMARAAMFENSDANATPSSKKGEAPKKLKPPTPGASPGFRSIPPAGGKGTGLTPRKLSPEKKSMGREPLVKSPAKTPSPSKTPLPAPVPEPPVPSPTIEAPVTGDVSKAQTGETPPVTAAERFSEIPLSATIPKSPAATASSSPVATSPKDLTTASPTSPSLPYLQSDEPEDKGTLRISPIPSKPSNLPGISTDSDVTPPAREKEKEKESKGFFGSALGFGMPSHAQSRKPSEESLSTDITSPPTEPPSTSAGWRSTMTHLLTRSTSGSALTPPMPARTPSPLAATSSTLPSTSHPPVPQASAITSSPTAVLLHGPAATPIRDRRLSKDIVALGVGEKSQEGFERVRGEMDSAAREMRRERDAKRSEQSSPSSPRPPHSPIAEAPEGAGETDWTFWGSVVQSYEDIAVNQPKELSKAIQMGIPPVIRGAIWQLMSSSKSSDLEESYKALLKMESSHEKAILKDLNRTFPSHKVFKEAGGLGQEGLFMVVKAYSIYDKEVGYTQGLAFIVAALLLNMPDEEAFCVLVRLMTSYNLRSHYTAEMQGLQLRLFQFDRLVEEVLPLVHTHFVRKGVKSSMYASQWFMTLFSYRFPLSLVYRVLDIVFAEGIEAIFRFSLALLKKSEAKLVSLEFEQILNYLQTDLYEVYKDSAQDEPAKGGEDDDGMWRADEFVTDAFEIRITPLMLDAYASEWEEQCRAANRHAMEVDHLRNINRTLSGQVKQLEGSLAAMNQEHVHLVRQLVMSKIEKEETENELVRYKMLYAEMAHAQQDALSVHSRLSSGSATTSKR